MMKITEIKKTFPSYNSKLKGKYSFEKLEDIKKGSLIFREKFRTFDFIIKRGPFSLCAYIELSSNFWPRFFLDYFPSYLDVHYGVTFEDINPKKNINIFGWDYAHSTDCLIENTLDKVLSGYTGSITSIKWDLHKVLENNIETIDNLVKYENILLNPKKEIILNLKTEDFLTKKLIERLLKKPNVF